MSEQVCTDNEFNHVDPIKADRWHSDQEPVEYNNSKSVKTLSDSIPGEVAVEDACAGYPME